MYDLFEYLLKAAKCLGDIVKVTMYETYADIEVMTMNKKKITLVMSVKEEEK